MNCGPNHRVKIPKMIFFQFQFSEIMWNFDRESQANHGDHDHRFYLAISFSLPNSGKTDHTPEV